jgi:hypothetical protein
MVKTQRIVLFLGLGLWIGGVAGAEDFASIPSRAEAYSKLRIQLGVKGPGIVHYEGRHSFLGRCMVVIVSEESRLSVQMQIDDFTSWERSFEMTEREGPTSSFLSASQSMHVLDVRIGVHAVNSAGSSESDETRITAFIGDDSKLETLWVDLNGEGYYCRGLKLSK